VELNEDFKTTFDKLIKAEENGAGNKEGGEEDIFELKEIAYKLICIGYERCLHFDMFKEAGLEWAFGQFAANLAVYALHLDWPKSEDGKMEIHAIAAKASQIYVPVVAKGVTMTIGSNTIGD
jgi:hypothetical protein